MRKDDSFFQKRPLSLLFQNEKTVRRDFRQTAFLFVFDCVQKR